MAVHQHVEARVRVELELLGPGNGWTNVSRDVLCGPGIQIRRGIRGSGINDLVAQTGTCTFVLDNTRHNSAGIIGYYSPDNPSCRPGFSETIAVRVLIVSPAVGTECVFIGTIEELKLTVGPRGRKDVTVTCVDWMEEAATFMLSGLSTQTNKRADELLTTLLATAGLKQPVGTSFDTGKDTFSFAFESIKDGEQSARAEADRIARSGFDRIWLSRDGILRYENRDYRWLNNVDPALRLNNSMFAMSPLRSRSRAINRLEVTAHPREIDPDYVVLYSLQDKPFVPPGGTITIRGDFRDPDNPDQKIGAVDVQEPLVAGLDYTMDATQTSSTGSADTPATDRPTATGFYNSFSGNVADVADDNSATSMSPTGGVVYHSFVMGGLPGVPDNATVTGVRTTVTIRHNASAPHYANLYWRLRYNGVDLDTPVGINPSSTGDTNPAGLYEFTVDWPVAPGGVAWNAAVYNDTEVALALNWDNATPEVVSVKRTCIYASVVASTDRTTNFTVVTVPGGNSAEFEITNDSTTDGAYVTKLQIRGKRILKNETATVVSQDATSITRNGRRPASFDMPYMSDTAKAKLLGDYVVALRKDPRTDIEQVTILGNRNSILMNAAVRMDVSSLVQIIEPVSGLAANYWINGVDLSIMRRGLILATWLLERADDTNYWIDGLSGHAEVGESMYVGPM